MKIGDVRRLFLADIGMVQVSNHKILIVMCNFVFRVIVGVAVVFLLHSCSSPQDLSSCKILEVDLEFTTPSVDDLFSRIEAVPLETNDSCLLMRLTQVLPHGNSLYVVDRRRSGYAGGSSPKTHLSIRKSFISVLKAAVCRKKAEKPSVSLPWNVMPC